MDFVIVYLATCKDFENQLPEDSDLTSSRCDMKEAVLPGIICLHWVMPKPWFTVGSSTAIS